MIWPIDDDTAAPPRTGCEWGCGFCEQCEPDPEALRAATDADAAYDERHDFTGID